jgi:acyl-CoA dehydrogenase
MAWDFETDPEFAEKLAWADAFVRDEVEPLDLVLADAYDVTDRKMVEVTRPLMERVKERGLWACHLGPDLGGQGFGQLKLALINEILGRSRFAPRIFGCQAPDSGNAEILAHYGTAAQQQRYLKPLLDGEIVSCYSLSEPHAGAALVGCRDYDADGTSDRLWRDAEALHVVTSGGTQVVPVDPASTWRLLRACR